MRWLVVVLAWLGFIEKPRFLVRYSETHPAGSELGTDELVVVRSGEFTKWACLKCPCGCGEKIALSLNKQRRPSWAVAVDWLGRPSVTPSVWQTSGCFSHFWIRGGAVQWCPGTGIPLTSLANGPAVGGND
jgi:hypothetical protein